MALFVGYSFICGACCGALMALTGPLPAQSVGGDMTLLSYASTMGFTCLGLGVTFGPPLAGWMFDQRGDYYLSFGFAAAAMMGGAAVMSAPLRVFGGEVPPAEKPRP
jgi:MFS family permease